MQGIISCPYWARIHLLLAQRASKRLKTRNHDSLTGGHSSILLIHISKCIELKRVFISSSYQLENFIYHNILNQITRLYSRIMYLVMQYTTAVFTFGIYCVKQDLCIAAVLECQGYQYKLLYSKIIYYIAQLMFLIKNNWNLTPSIPGYDLRLYVRRLVRYNLYIKRSSYKQA